MGSIDTWKEHNRKEQGTTRADDLGYNVVDGSNVHLDIHEGNAAMSVGSVGDMSKEETLRSYREQLNPTIISDMLDDIGRSANVNVFFSRLEDRNIPLTYLTALGIPGIEEEIQQYLTLKSRGIDIDSYGSSDDLGGVNPEYVTEVLANQRDLPVLLDQSGTPIKELIQGSRGPMSNYESSQITDLKEKLAKAEQRVKQLEDNRVANKSYEQLQSKGTASTGGTTKSGDDALAKLRELANTSKVATKMIYMLSNKELKHDKLANYQYTRITSIKQLEPFLNDPTSILVITSNMSKTTISQLVTFAKRLMKSNQSLRIATLASAPVELPIIKGTVELTDDSISKFDAEN